jgi:hypothetical protein
MLGVADCIVDRVSLSYHPDRMATHRKLDRRHDDLCAGGLRKREEAALMTFGATPGDSIQPQKRFWRDPRRGKGQTLRECHESVMKISQNSLFTWCRRRGSNPHDLAITGF